MEERGDLADALQLQVHDLSSLLLEK